MIEYRARRIQPIDRDVEFFQAFRYEWEDTRVPPHDVRAAVLTYQNERPVWWEYHDYDILPLHLMPYLTGRARDIGANFDELELAFEMGWF